MKSKRDEDDEGEDDFEWEEAPTSGMHLIFVKFTMSIHVRYLSNGQCGFS